MKSLAYRTDLIFHRFDGRVTQRENYWVIETPSNPSFFWGNMLIFRHPPTLGDLHLWMEIFRREFGHNPQIKHMTFAWDSPEGIIGAVEPFIHFGFKLEQSVVMTASQVRRPARFNSDVSVRPLATHAEWEAATENQVLCRSAGFNLQRYTTFKRERMARYREMTRAGRGFWFGAFLGDRLVADLGIYQEDGIGRFQAVETHPDFRRLGICGTLVFQAAEVSFKEMKTETLVMVANQNYYAVRIYESVGFKPTENQVGICWWDRTVWS